MDEKDIIIIRKVETYESDDGRRIEKHIFHRKILLSEDAQEEAIKVHPDDLIFREEKKSYFIGIATIPTPIGVHEIKFPIEGGSLYEAYIKFEESFNNFIEETQSDIIQPGDGPIII